MENNKAPIPKLDNSQNNQTSALSENDQIILNDSSDTSAGVVNKPVTITSSNDMTSNTNNSENTNNEKFELNSATIKSILLSAKKPFLKL